MWMSDREAKAYDVLRRAADLIEERGVQRDADGGERTMARTVDLFNAYHGDDILNETDGWVFMVCLKLARARAGKTVNMDDWEDMVAYSALATESVAKRDRAELAAEEANRVELAAEEAKRRTRVKLKSFECPEYPGTWENWKR